MSKASDFLHSHGFRAEVDADGLLEEFARQMDAGLDGRAPASLAMIPAYVSDEGRVPPDRPVLALDAGGTNFRIALVRFTAGGEARVEDYRSGPMPGTNGESLTADGFYGALAEAVRPFAAEVESIGFCFSYTAEITPDCDARLLFWTKQVEVPGIVGTLVGRGFREAIRARCGRDLPLRIVNDTVAALLAGRGTPVGREASAAVGIVLGTGTNAAYVERSERIGKLGLPPGGRMAVNIESGNFDGGPSSDFDQAMDAPLPDAGAYRFEKMISGAYLGRLCLTVLRTAAREGLFSDGAARAILALGDLSTRDIDEFTAVGGALSGTALDAVPFADGERRLAADLCEPLFLRAARLSAVHFAAAILRASSAARDPARPVCATIDGSTYYKTKSAGFRATVERDLRGMLSARGVPYELVGVPDAPLLGAAVVGLLKG